MQVQHYLFFYGRCEEALAFYADKLGAQVLFQMRGKDAPGENAIKGEHGDRIMHASFRIGETTLMASDGSPDQPAQPHSGFSVAISLDDVGKGKELFDALAEGGKVGFPWQATFWAKGFGMVSDKFGIPWMVSIEKDMPQA
jgi:PhnB protein